MVNVFEEVTPIPPVDPLQELSIQLGRSMMWDMIGPYKIRDNPALYGQQPASIDVLEAEAQESFSRKHVVGTLGMEFPLLCHIAAESASRVMLVSDGITLEQDQEMAFRMAHVQYGTAVAETVVGHLLQKGLLKLGDNHVVLGK
jgi:hypothetical protein